MTAPAILPGGGKLRRDAVGLFTSYLVDAVDRDMATIQGRIAARRDGYSPIDVAQVTQQADRTWLVEMQIQETGELIP